MIPITVGDVQDRLRRELTNDEIAQFAGIAQEASDVVEGHLQFSYAQGDEIPSAVRTVTSRAASRAYSRSGSAQEGIDSRSAGMGTMSFTTHHSADSLTAGPYLFKGEKATIDRFAKRVNCVPMSRE